MAYEIELKGHQETHHLMAAISRLLRSERDDYEKSMVCSSSSIDYHMISQISSNRA
jgi:hypothetical protein